MTMTLKDIAKKANVSTATVSYALNNTGNISLATRERILKIAGELNYQPNRIAKSLRAKRTYTIGILVEDITAFHSPKIINGINEYAEDNGYHVVLSDLRLREKLKSKYDELYLHKDKINQSINVLLSFQVDGIIYIGLHDRNIGGIIENVDKPVAYTYCYTENKNDLSITYDNRNISYRVTQYLLGLGHHKIGIISGPLDSMPSCKRLAGYRAALRDNKIALNEDYIKTGDWGYDLAVKKGLELLELQNPPTAIFAMNDIMAIGVIDAAKSQGYKVPDDLSIVGFDNTEMSKFYNPRLTTVKIPFKKMGYLAAKELDQLIIKDNTKGKSLVLPSVLLKRDSVKNK